MSFEYEVGGIKCWLDGDDARRFFGNHIRSDPAGYLVMTVGLKTYLLHRLVLGLKKSDDICVDHINGVRSDNRKANLRLATTSQNGMNRVRLNNSSGITGIYWGKSRERWCAHIAAGKKRIFLGRFASLEDAVKARRKAEDTYHGQFAARHGAQCVDLRP